MATATALRLEKEEVGRFQRLLAHPLQAPYKKAKAEEKSRKARLIPKRKSFLAAHLLRVLNEQRCLNAPPTEPPKAKGNQGKGRKGGSSHGGAKLHGGLQTELELMSHLSRLSLNSFQAGIGGPCFPPLPPAFYRDGRLLAAPPLAPFPPDLSTPPPVIVPAGFPDHSRAPTGPNQREPPVVPGPEVIRITEIFVFRMKAAEAARLKNGKGFPRGAIAAAPVIEDDDDEDDVEVVLNCPVMPKLIPPKKKQPLHKQ